MCGRSPKSAQSDTPNHLALFHGGCLFFGGSRRLSFSGASLETPSGRRSRVAGTDGRGGRSDGFPYGRVPKCANGCRRRFACCRRTKPKFSPPIHSRQRFLHISPCRRFCAGSLSLRPHKRSLHQARRKPYKEERRGKYVCCFTSAFALASVSRCSSTAFDQHRKSE